MLVYSLYIPDHYIMKFKQTHFLLIISTALLLTACSRHHGTGVWKTDVENSLGISRLVVGFDGRAEFASTKPEKTNWHCFWRGSKEKELLLECTPSTNPDNKQSYILNINDQGLAELRNDSSLLATFTRTDENPSPKK